jgi:hypothetical protein
VQPPDSGYCGDIRIPCRQIPVSMTAVEGTVPLIFGHAPDDFPLDQVAGEMEAHLLAGHVCRAKPRCQ